VDRKGPKLRTLKPYVTPEFNLNGSTGTPGALDGQATCDARLAKALRKAATAADAQLLATLAVKEAIKAAEAAKVTKNLTGAVRMIDRLLAKQGLRSADWKFGEGNIVTHVMAVWRVEGVKRESLQKRWRRSTGDADADIGMGGRHTMLTDHEEARVVAWVEMCRSHDLSATVPEFQAFVAGVLDNRGITHVPSETWCRAFCFDHNLVVRAARSKEQSRCGLTEYEVALYFHTVNSMGTPALWVNFDETGFHGYSDNLKKCKVIVPEANRQEAHRGTSNVRDHVTVMSVTGITGDSRKTEVFTPLFVFPGKTLNTTMVSSTLDPNNQRPNYEGVDILQGNKSAFLQCHPDGLAPPPNLDLRVSMSASASGHVNGQIILAYFKDVFIPELRAKGYNQSQRVFLVGDLHVSHKTPELFKSQSDSLSI
jgi:hypothetical protein